MIYCPDKKNKSETRTDDRISHVKCNGEPIARVTFASTNQFSRSSIALKARAY